MSSDKPLATPPSAEERAAALVSWTTFRNEVAQVIRSAEQARDEWWRGKLAELERKWRKQALDAVPAEWKHRPSKYLKMDNEPAGWDACADELAALRKESGGGMRGIVFLRALIRGNWRFARLIATGTLHGLTHRTCRQCGRRKKLNASPNCYQCQWNNLQRFLVEEPPNDERQRTSTN